DCEDTKVLFAPVSYDKEFSVVHGESLSGNLIGSDYIPEDSVLIAINSSIASPDLSGDFVWQAPDNFAGDIIFYYNLVNQYDLDCTEEVYQGTGNFAMVTIHVTNAPPVANDDDYKSYKLVEGGKLEIEEDEGLLANDTDADDPHEKLRVAQLEKKDGHGSFQS